MDPVRNPFLPGAGAPPPELVGRDKIIGEVDTALRRMGSGRLARSKMLLGLRGTGKTVLLSHIAEMAVNDPEYATLTAQIESPDENRFAEMLYPELHKILRKLSMMETAKALSHTAMRTLRSFVGTLKLEHEGTILSVDPEVGSADSGDLEIDLADLFVSIGRAAKSGGQVFLLLVDEVQYLSQKELSALIRALHACNQKSLPVLFIGAGLPQITGLAGNAKSYAERLFEYHSIGAIGAEDAKRAISDPIKEEGEQITEAALDAISKETDGYPYFLQEWGYQVWNIADASPIDRADVETATPLALKRLDNGFFKVRMDRLTPKEREYVHAMASLPGPGPYRSGDIAEVLGESSQRLGPRRSAIIRKGMIYSPEHGDTAFTVPGFAEYLCRTGFAESE